MKNKYIEKLVEIMLKQMPNVAEKSMLFAFYDGIVTTYHYYHYEADGVIRHDPDDLPSDEVMDYIQQVRDNDEVTWTAFVLATHTDSTYLVDYFEDLNPILECSSALLWLEYIHYNIEPSSDFCKSQLEQAIKAEKFKKTLNYACMRNDINAVKEKLKDCKQTILNKKGPDKKTPLHIACLNGNVEIVKLLVEAGADVKVKYHGQTPFALACMKGDMETVKYFIHKGEDVNEVMVRKEMPLHLISGSGNKEIMEYILERVNNINAVTSWKYSALHYAVEGDNVAGAKVLIDKGLDLEIVDKYKRSALSLACNRNKPEMVALLLENGANINSLGQSQITPLHIACKQGFIEVVRVLLKYKPNLHAKATLYSMPHNEEVKETPIETAKRLGHEEITNLLSLNV